MEEDLQLSPDLDFTFDNDAKYISGLSTIMVATIQEVKDRISQIEYMFCGQLYPKFQSKPTSLQRRFFETMKSAEDGWRMKERQLLNQIRELQRENKKSDEENQKLVASLEEKAKSMSDKIIKTAEEKWKVEMEELRNEKQKALEEKAKLLNDCEAEKKLLLKKLENAEVEFKWQETLQKIETDAIRNQLQQTLDENKDLYASRGKDRTILNELETEKKLLLDKLESLEKNEEVAKLQNQLNQKLEELSEGKKLQEELFQQIMNEKNKRKEVFDRYKKLKSQYTFLCNKFGLNTENSLSSTKIEEDQKPCIAAPSNIESPSGASSPVCVKSEPSRSPTASNFHPLKVPIGAKSEPPRTSLKRSAPSWRGTRSRQQSGGADPHDDFLDTPLENVKGKLNKSSKEVHDFPVPAPEDMEFNSSDDETQDLNVQEKQPISITKPGGFKYVESVRKKADRENLKGFECKQCRKFYDAVLPENGKNGENSNNSNFRCEHHDGVSRHRYKYVPPMTPEGFWNIGFESEM